MAGVVKVATKYCNKCERTLDVDRFSKCASKSDGLQSNCNSCRSKMGSKNRARLQVSVKACAICAETKEAIDFPVSRSSADGLYFKCKECVDRFGRDPVIRNRAYKAYLRYGLTEDQFMAMSPVCEICGTDEDLVIDHDHVTSVVRGRLCRNHNAGIGLLGDSVEALEAALDYLRSA